MIALRRGALRWIAALFLSGLTVAAAAAPIAHTPLGDLAGVYQRGAHAFLGIRYAEPPTGNFRWRAPRPVAAWKGVRRAQQFGHNCWQAVSPKGFGPWTHEYVVQGDISEDCLFLNVWAPGRVRGRAPVLVWIHGGGFNSGSGSIPIYDGRALASRGIVVVTINYRVGLFGFLAHPDLTREAGMGPNANFGLQDMVAALKWVRGNIAAFGGDPKAVTIAGQSAGAMAVHDLMASPLARGLFARAIAESGLPDMARPPALAAAEADGLAFARDEGVSSIAALRAMPAEALAASKGGNIIRFTPVIDGVLLPGPRPISRVPILVGFNADEGSALGKDYGSSDPEVFRRLLKDTYGDSTARFAPLYPAATPTALAQSNRQLHRDRGAGALYAWARMRGDMPPIYAYRWDHREPGSQSDHWGAFHSSEIPYVFQTFGASPERRFGAADKLLSERVSTYWLNFVRTGDPNGQGVPDWPRFDLRDPHLLAIGDHIEKRFLLPPDKMAALRAFVAEGGHPSLF